MARHTNHILTRRYSRENGLRNLKAVSGQLDQIPGVPKTGSLFLPSSIIRDEPSRCHFGNGTALYNWFRNPDTRNTKTSKPPVTDDAGQVRVRETDEMNTAFKRDFFTSKPHS